MVNAGEHSSNEASAESEGALMAKREMHALDVVMGKIALPNPALEDESTLEIADDAAKYIQELAARVYHICSDKKMDNKHKQHVCNLFF